MLPALAVALVAATVPITPRLTMQLIERCAPAAACAADVVVEMKREAERIWSSFGIQLVWIEPLDSRSAGLAAVPDVIVMFEGHPQPILGAPHRDSPVLANHSQPDTPCQPGIVHLWVAQVRRHLETVHVHGLPMVSVPTRLEHIVLARALGRALAHEIGHHVLGPGHSDHGLMRAQFSADEALEVNPPGRYDLDDTRGRMLAARAWDRTMPGCVVVDAPIRLGSQR
jgi:hypothetical protein